ncbi:MAG: SDR family NAD(P)-dependent oxidoreductase [Proteobacteria bacterium]|nr:SDR family NAD(P)-dependent oxidoreductase [Pseudomonadota bacterium]
MRSPKSILITGGSSGIGEALALEYAASGIHLALTGRDQARLEAVAGACRAKGAEVVTGLVDVRDAAAMRQWIEAEDDKTPFDLVIANAGVSREGLQDLDREARLRRVLATNIDGVINTVQPALDRMRVRERGQVAVMSSIASFLGMPRAIAYSTSKAAVRIYGEGLRGEARRDGIEVSVICPGYIRSPLTKNNTFPMPFLMDADRAAKIIRRGLARDAARIAFPFPMYALVWFMAALPAFVSDRLSRIASGNA